MQHDLRVDVRRGSSIPTINAICRLCRRLLDAHGPSCQDVSGTWPRYTTERPTVQVSAAYGEQVPTGVPYAVAQAALMLAARLYQRKASPMGLTTGYQDWGPMRISKQDPDVYAALMPYKVLATA